MAKLYPPHIEGTIPAFTGATLVVPFSMNRAVGAKEVYGMVLKVKKVNSNEVILTKETINFDAYANCKAVFNLEAAEQGLFNIGQYYRVQLAYIGAEGAIGYFSTVGVIKYTALPEIKLVGLNNATSNMHIYDYVAAYTQTEDPTEKLYSSRLRLIDEEDNIIEDTGEVLHSVLNDTLPNEALEYFNISRDLNLSKTYRLILTMTSINGVTVRSPKYRIIQRENSDLKFDEIKDLILLAKTNFDDAYSEITIRPIPLDKEVISGFFVLSRSEAKQPYEWKRIHKFVAKSDLIKNIHLTDYTIEQGKKYVYCLQQYNNYGVFSNRLISNEIYADFEDVFLLDGERQLKIRFNPKISSMKDNILETKSNTIGSKYPFITRNGRVNHKEFSLSGLVSYQMDDNKFFMGWENLGIENNITDLTSENIAAERTFKLEVLKWLNDGKPKVLKSPTEGNYIVRLMNVSMSPNDTVGRMLHNFNCNASEIAPFTYEALTQYNFIGLQEPDKTVSKWKTINFSETVQTDNGSEVIYKTGELLRGEHIYSIKVTGMIPGSIIYINNEPFYVGSTGAYMAKMSTPISSFKLPENAKYNGALVVEYKDNLYTNFDDIRAIHLVETPVQQIIGNTYWGNGNFEYINIIKALQDVKTEIVNIPKIKFVKRGIHKIYVQHDGNEGQYNLSSTFYSNGNSIDDRYKINLNDLDKLSLYEIHYSSYGCDIMTQRTYNKDEYIADLNEKMASETEEVMKDEKLSGAEKLNKIKDIEKKYQEKIKYIEEEIIYPTPGSKITYRKKVGDKVIEFEPYSGVYYDPQYKAIIEDSFDIFNVNVNGNYFNIEDTEEREIKDFNYNYISIGDGVIAELTLLTQVLDYSYEFDHEIVSSARKAYDEAYKLHQSNIVSGVYNGSLEEDLFDLKKKYKRLLEVLEAAIIEDYTMGG